MRIRVSTAFPHWPLKLQSPSGSGVWDGVEFLVDQEVDRADGWIVFEGVREVQSTVCPGERVVLVTFEPPAIKSYDPRYTRQFARVLTCHAMDHGGLILGQQCLPWHYGRNVSGEGDDRFLESYDSLVADDPFSCKERLASVICSAKRSRDCHRRRNRFVELLGEAGIDGLDLFGRGRAREVSCKRDAIRPYRYHVVLENSSCPHYWSEKLADAYLGGAFPIYWGCPNLEEYFPEGSFARIDIDDPEGAVNAIREIIQSDAYSKAVPLLRLCRELILERYNFFPTMAKLIRSLDAGETRRVTLRPEELFSIRGRIRRIRLGIKRMMGAECDMR